MNASVNDEGEESFERLVRALMAQHGRLRVLRAVLLQRRERREERVSAADLSAHLRRDIGLPPEDGGRGW